LHGITLFLLEEDKKIRTTLIIAWLIGFSHAIAFLESNQYGYVINIALLSASLISILLSLREKDTKKFIGMCVLITFCFLGYARTEHVFWQTSPSTLTEQCSEGSVKGIYVTKETKKFYDERIADIKEKNITSKDNVLFLTQDTFLPLEITAPVAQYSCWLSGVNEATFSRLKTYYAMVPEKYQIKFISGKNMLIKRMLPNGQNSMVFIYPKVRSVTF